MQPLYKFSTKQNLTSLEKKLAAHLNAVLIASNVNQLLTQFAARELALSKLDDVSFKLEAIVEGYLDRLNQDGIIKPTNYFAVVKENSLIVQYSPVLDENVAVLEFDLL